MKTLFSLLPWFMLTCLFPASAFCGVDLAILSGNLHGIASVAADFDCVEWMLLVGLAVWVTLGFYNMRPRGGR